MKRAIPVGWQRDVPDVIRAHDTIDKPDYADLFTAVACGDTDVSPERWARAMFEHAPRGRVRLVLVAAVLAQRRILGLRLESRRSPDHLLGWRIAAAGENWIRLEAESALLTGHLVLQRDGRKLHLATFVRYHRRLATLIWPPVSLLHRRVGIVLMRHAAMV